VIAGIDVHKKMLAVVVSDVEIGKRVPVRATDVWQATRTTAIAAAWLVEQQAEEVVMGTTANIGNQSGERWKVLEAATREARRRKAEVRKVHLAQAQSNRDLGAKKDFS